MTPRPNPLWTLAGLLSLGVGIIGIFLPLVPTTAPVLLAAFCFSRGSPRMQDWLLSHPRFGPLITDWQENGAIRPSAKRAAIIAMALAFVLSAVLGLSLVLLILQAMILLAVAGFILTRPDG